MTRWMRLMSLVAAAIAVGMAAGGAPARALAVRVLGPGGEDGLPLEGARASLWSIDERENHVLLGRVGTNADGVANLPRVGKGRHALVVWADGHVRREIELDGEPRARLDVRIERGASRTLRIRDEAGRPVRRIRLTVVPEEILSGSRIAVLSLARDLQGPGVRKLGAARGGSVEFALEGYRPRVLASETGDYAVDGLAEGRHRVLVGAPLFGVQQVIVGTEKREPVVVVLDRTRCHEVRIVDRRTGHGIEGAFAASLPAFAEGPWARIWPAWRSGVDGRLVVRCPDSRRRLASWVDETVIAADGYAPTVLDASEEVSTIHLGRGGRISGTAMDTDQVPLVGRRLVATVEGFVRRATVDASGRFAIDGVPEGIVDVQLLDPEDGSWIAARRLEVRRDGEYVVDFTPGRPLHLVVRRNGRPWSEVAVTLVTEQAAELSVLDVGRTDRSGHVRLSMPEGNAGKPGLVFSDGRQTLSAPLPEKPLLRRVAEVALRRSDEPLEVEFPGRFIEGEVVDAGTGEPLAHRPVVARGGAGSLCRAVLVDTTSPLYVDDLRGLASVCNGEYAEAGTDSRGRFRIFVPDRFRYLEARGDALVPGLDAYESMVREIAELPDDEPVTFRLQRAGGLRVTVTDASGAVPDGCVVRWRVAAWGPGGNAVAAACGEPDAQLSPPPDTPVLVVARAPGLAPAVEGPLVFTAGGRKPVRLILRRGGTLRVRFDAGLLPRLDGRAYLPPGVVRDSAGRDWTMIVVPDVSAAARELVFAPLPPGRWTVQLGKERETVRLREGEEVVVELGR